MTTMILIALALVHLTAGSCREVQLPSEKTPVYECEVVEHSAGFTRCSFGDRDLTAGVNALVERRLREEAQYGDTDGAQDCQEGEEPLTKDFEAWCDPPYVRADVISFACGASWTTGVHPDASSFAINLRVNGRSIEEVTLPGVLVDRAADDRLWALVREKLRLRIKECAEYAKEEPADQEVGSEKEVDSVYFSASGLVFTYRHWTFGYCVHDVTIPYSSLRGILNPHYARPHN